MAHHFVRRHGAGSWAEPCPPPGALVTGSTAGVPRPLGADSGTVRAPGETSRGGTRFPGATHAAAPGAGLRVGGAQGREEAAEAEPGVTYLAAGWPRRARPLSPRRHPPHRTAPAALPRHGPGHSHRTEEPVSPVPSRPVPPPAAPRKRRGRPGCSPAARRHPGRPGRHSAGAAPPGRYGESSGPASGGKTSSESVRTGTAEVRRGSAVPAAARSRARYAAAPPAGSGRARPGTPRGAAAPRAGGCPRCLGTTGTGNLRSASSPAQPGPSKPRTKALPPFEHV